MKKSIEFYRKIVTQEIFTMTEKDKYYLYDDMRNDLLEQNAEIVKMKGIFKTLAYPRGGTSEEEMTIQGAKEIIQRLFTREYLES